MQPQTQIKTRTELVPFHDKKIVAFYRNGSYFIALKPVCENIGIDWSSQRSRIKRDYKFSSTMVIMTMVAGDGKIREMVCLPLEIFPGWLYTLSVNRVRDLSAAHWLLVYQQEAGRILFEHFFGSRRKSFGAPLPGPVERPLLATDPSREFIVSQRDAIFYGNMHVFRQAQWFWRLYQHFHCDLWQVAEIVGLFNSTIRRYVTRYQRYLEASGEYRKQWSGSMYDDIEAKNMSVWYESSGLDFWKLFFSNDSMLWDPHPYAAKYQSSTKQNN